MATQFTNSVLRFATKESNEVCREFEISKLLEAVSFGDSEMVKVRIGKKEWKITLKVPHHDLGMVPDVSTSRSGTMPDNGLRSLLTQGTLTSDQSDVLSGEPIPQPDFFTRNPTTAATLDMFSFTAFANNANENSNGLLKAATKTLTVQKPLLEQKNDREIRIDENIDEHHLCKKLGTSYCFHPDKFILAHSSGRTDLDNEVLNSQWLCTAVTATTDDPKNQFVDTLRSKSSNEDSIRNVEDEELFEIDMIIETCTSIIGSLKPILERMEGMTSQEWCGFVNPDISGDSGDTVRALNRAFGAEASEIIALIMSTPSVAIPMVLERVEATKRESEDYRYNLPNAKAERTQWLIQNKRTDVKPSKEDFIFRH